MKTDIGLSQRILSEYKLTGQWQINVKGWALVAMVAGGILVFGLSFILGMAIRDLFRGVYEGRFSFELISFLIILGAILAIIILHEAIHGVLFLIIGGKPRFGFKLIGRFFPVAYATSTLPILRNQYLLVCMGPFLILTLILMLASLLATTDGIAMLLIMAMALNVSGSLADLMIAYKILRRGRRTLFKDTQDGFNWYVSSRQC